VKDVAAIEGIRDNQLVGYGWWWTARHGDSSQTVFPAQTLVSVLERLGVTVPQTGSNSASNMQVKNMAGSLWWPRCRRSAPGIQAGRDGLLGRDARSLDGGILLMTPLYGPDGQIFAQAQGALVLGGYLATGGGSAKQVNHPTTARIPDGALVERPVPFDLKQLHSISVVMNDADFHTAERMAARSTGRWLGSRSCRGQPPDRAGPSAGRGCGGADRQGEGPRWKFIRGPRGGERAHRDGGDRRHGAAAAGLHPARRIDRECD